MATPDDSGPRPYCTGSVLPRVEVAVQVTVIPIDDLLTSIVFLTTTSMLRMRFGLISDYDLCTYIVYNETG